jgi:CheY-like chemotaxis protein
MHPIRILLIEEDEISQEVLKLMLSNKFNLTVLDDPKQAEKAVATVDYSIIIMNMQSVLYESLTLCKTISSQSISSSPIVIGLGEESSEEKVRAIFEAGVYDYFIKPYNVVLFYESLQRIVNTIDEYKELEANEKSSRDAFGTALSQTSYYGFAFDLLSEINSTKSIESLAQIVLSGLSNRGVHCALQITDTDGEIKTFEQDKDVIGERTLQVFSFVRDQGRIFRFSKRLVFNDENASLFVKSMDDMSDTAYDCVLDIGAKLIPCIESQLVSISEHLLLEELQVDTKNIVEKLHYTMTKQANKADGLVQKVAGEIAASIHKLGLTEDQENFFLEMIETELQVEFKGADFEAIEYSAKLIYEKIFTLQNRSEKPSLHNSQFGDIDLF